MLNNIIEKNECLGNINKNNTPKNIKHIHPLVNIYREEQINKEQCYILPQFIDNKLQLLNDPIRSEKLILNSDVLSDSTISEQNTIINPISYFTLPINSNNFLEIVLNITNISQLNQFINSLDDTDIELLDFVISLYWKNNFNNIDEDMTNFIIINKKIIKKFFNKDLNDDIIFKMIEKLIKKNYGKKIKYIKKIKKYLIKYI